MNQIFIIVHDGGCEGLSAPIQACVTFEEAVSIATLMSSNERYKIYVVPVWPKSQEKPWFSLDHVWPKS